MSDEKDLTGIGELQALLGQGADFQGKLTFKGRIRVDGNLRGEVFSEGVLIIGPSAVVEADIEVGTLIIRGGVLRGNTKATRLVEIYAPSRVYGDIHAPQLYMDKGVVFEGNCTMLDDKSSEPEPGAASEE